MMHILITSLMSSTPRMEANELPLFWCICKMVFPFHKSSVHCRVFFLPFLSFPYLKFLPLIQVRCWRRWWDSVSCCQRECQLCAVVEWIIWMW
jgi:hypothetical protein